MKKLNSIIIGLLVILLMGCVAAETQPLEPSAGQVDQPIEETTDTIPEQDEAPAESTPLPEPIIEEEESEEEMDEGREEESVDEGDMSEENNQESIEVRETIAASGSASQPTESEDGAQEADVVPAPVIVGEVPEQIMTEIMADISTRSTNADQVEMVVRRAEAVVFPDGSLGCPQPGEFYTMALVSGFVVEVEVDGQVYDYRVSDNGFFRLCESGRPFTPPAIGTPSS